MEEKMTLTKTEPIVVRCIEPEDNAAVAQVIRSSVIEHGAPLVGTIYDDPHTDTMYQTFKEKNAEYWVIEHDEVILGGGGFYPTIGLPEGYAELTRLHLSPEARGKGLGKYLLQLIEKRAAKLGYTHMYLVSYPFFGKAISIYERYGYTHITEVLDESGLFEGAPYHMVKTIGTSTDKIGHSHSSVSKDIEIVPYESCFRNAFKILNEEWITKYFKMEDIDNEAINNPEKHILEKGGEIFVALYKKEPVGVCALLKLYNGDYEYEMTKLAVSPTVQGKGIGCLLGQTIVNRVKELGGKNIYLESNTVLKPAIHIYKKLGFKEVFGHTTSYQRCNIQMELTIDSPICNKDEKNLSINTLDYKPSLKGSFTTLVGNWLSDMLNGELEQEDLFTINNPGEAYLLNGGFVFFAEYGGEIVGCVALKRLDESQFEFAKLIVTKEARRLGVATKLIEKCIARCKENKISNLWLQTTNKLVGAHKLYYKMGFMDKEAPKSMAVLKRTEKIMVLQLNDSFS